MRCSAKSKTSARRATSCCRVCCRSRSTYQPTPPRNMPDNSITQSVAQPSLRVDRGARFYKCDFQVHTPRDSRWAGEFSEIVSDADRKAYAKAFVATCRRKGLNGVAITDHHDLCLFSFVREAAAAEVKSDGKAYLPHEKLVVFPGIELTLSE